MEPMERSTLEVQVRMRLWCGTPMDTNKVSTTSKVTVFSDGALFRMRSADLLDAFEHAAPLLHLLLR